MTVARAGRVRRATVVATVVSVAGLAAAMVRFGNFAGGAGAAAFMFAIFLFNASPAVIACLMARRSPPALMLLFVVGWSLYAGRAILVGFMQADAQSGLVFVSLPFIGLAALLVVVVTGAIWRRIVG